MNKILHGNSNKILEFKLNSKIDVPLVIDLDGTLVLTDTLHESVIIFFKKNPFINIFLMMFWLFQGKAKFKDNIAKHTEMRVDLIPYNQFFLHWVKLQSSEGRKLILCTAASKKIADKIASHLKIFDDVISSSKIKNLSSKDKALILEDRFSKTGFIYAGNSSDDLFVWQKASESILVNASSRVKNSLKKIVNSYLEFPPSEIKMIHWMKMLRLHQWSKNILIFLPLVAAHQFYNFENIFLLLCAFISIGLCASSTYMLNDIIDLESDRLHPRKKLRPFASGEVPVIFSLIMLLLFPCSILIALLIEVNFALILVLYSLITLSYSFYLKSIVIIDCIVLAALYTIRIIAGAIVINNVLSFWLLAFSILFFLSLAFLKRYAEMLSTQNLRENIIHGRGYLSSDNPLILSLGISSGLGSVIVMMLYLNSPEILKLYNYTEIVWCTIPILLFWVSHIWLQAHRGKMHDDPVIFAIKDHVSILSSIAFFICIILGARGF